MSNAITAARRATSAKLAGLELPSCFAQATVSAAVNAIDRNTVSAKASRRRLASKAMKIASVETPEPRVTCPVCKGAATCMLCDDNGQVPTSSLTVDERRANDRPVRSVVRS